MALDSFFRDRDIRHNMRTQIREAKEVGFSTCDSCGKKASVLEAFGHNLCEDCCNTVLEASYDFDRVYEEPITESNVEDIISEQYVLPDMNKLNQAAQKSFNGSIPELMKSYGLNPHKEWDDRLSKGRIFIRDNEISGGKTKVNKFLSDFDCSFTTLAAAQKLVPDKDGTSAPLKVNGKLVSSSSISAPAPAKAPSPSNRVTTQPSHVTKNIQVGPGIKATGDNQNFEVKLTPTITLSCHQTGKSQGSKVDIEVKAGSLGKGNVLVETDYDATKLAHNVIEAIKEKPGLIFPSFEDENEMKNGFKLNKYPAYSFKFDDKSFDGHNISLILNLNNKPYERSRVYLTDKSLSKRVQLNRELQEFMDVRLKTVYPMLFNGTADIKTSIGKASTELIQIDSSPKSDLGEASIRTELANRKIDWKVTADRFKDRELTRNTVCDVIYGAFNKFIPGWDDPSINSSGSKTNNFQIVNFNYDGELYTITAGFDLSDFYDTGDIKFDISVINKQGEEYTSTEVYRKANTPLKDFLSREAEKLCIKNSKSSNSKETKLSYTANQKMSSPSKKESFLYKLSSKVYEWLRDYSSKMLDLSCTIDTFEVNKDGYVTKCDIRVYDENNEVAKTSEELKDALKLDITLSNTLKVKKVDDSPSSMSEYGPSVVYSVKDIEDFAVSTNIKILEHLMFEAYGITYISESTGRKQIFA